MKDIVIIGAGGLGRELLVLLHQLNDVSAAWNILGFYDDDTSLSGTSINHLPYLGTINDLEAVQQELAVAIGIGSPKVKQQLVARLQLRRHLYFPVLVHPSVSIKAYQFITLGAGAILAQGVVLTTNIKLGKHVFINLCCTIGHDATLGDFSSLMPGVNLSGATVLEEAVYVGTNATILQGISVGAHTTIGAGAVVNKDLPAGCTAVGVPAKIIKKHEL
ncbi:acetyltransferase [Pontibacter qinzhouensis]|uniref:Acetyltransferase n=1 Tax=Pontibacter qinzhouensis TaxID=2603253 RepID=A0A5C8K5F4_9BACT|nr:acetyltransferase [Pontibacter qinzhouensis]TXK45903.1 acetyltransferase [Pontibacter qinzhouensis]